MKPFSLYIETDFVTNLIHIASSGPVTLTADEALELINLLRQAQAQLRRQKIYQEFRFGPDS